MIRFGIGALLSLFLLTACFEQRLAVRVKQGEPVSRLKLVRGQPSTTPQKAAPRKKQPEAQQKTLKAVGYGVESDYLNYPPPRKRLLAIRAAKVDAYRNLAEMLYGTRITGMTTVRDAAIESDRFRAYIDAVVRGAQLLALTPKGEGIYEAELELQINEALYRCFANLTPDCIGQTRTEAQTQPAADAEPPPRESIEITIETDHGGARRHPEVVYYKD